MKTEPQWRLFVQKKIPKLYFVCWGLKGHQRVNKGNSGLQHVGGFCGFGFTKMSQRWSGLGDNSEGSGVGDSFGSAEFNSSKNHVPALCQVLWTGGLSVPTLLNLIMPREMQTNVTPVAVWWQTEAAASSSARPRDLESQASVQVPNSPTSSSLTLGQLASIFKLKNEEITSACPVHVMGCYEDLMRSFIWKPFWTHKEKFELLLRLPRTQFWSFQW